MPQKRQFLRNPTPSRINGMKPVWASPPLIRGTLRGNTFTLIIYQTHVTGTDVKPYVRHFSLLALIAKTKLADLPTDSRASIISHLETFQKRLTRNSVEVYIQEVRDTPFRPRQKLPTMTMRFGVASAPGTVSGNWALEADGSLVLPEGAKRRVIQITDISGMTEDTTS